MRMRHARCLPPLVAVILLAAVAGTAAAQITTGTVAGSVKDRQGSCSDPAARC